MSMSSGKRVVVFMLLVVSCLITYGSRPIPASAIAGINPNISFTGKLVKSDNTNITDGTYNMEFKVYQDGTNTGVGSTLLWTEDYLVAGSTGMPSTGGVTFSSGTFSVNLGSICVFTAGTCGAKTNTGIDFNQNTLWASVQIGNTTSCTVTSSTTSFNTACGGDGEMSPYIRLTAVPYASNAALLSGIAVTALGQLANNQTFTGTDTFQPTTNISSALIKQTSAASPSVDIFNVQTANSTTLLQFTGPSANASNIVFQSAGASSTISVGTNAIANTIQIGDAATINTGNIQAINIGNLSVAGTTNVTLGAFTGATTGNTTLQAFGTLVLQTATAGTINVGANAVANTIQIGQNGANAVTQTIGIGNGGAGSTTNVTVGNSVAGTTTLQNSATINLNAGTIVGNVAAQTLFNTVATSANIFGASTTITEGGAGGATTFGNTGAYTLQGVSGQSFSVNAQGAATLSLDTGLTGTVNIGANANNKTINLGPTGATVAAVAVNFATSTGAAQNIKLGGVGTSSITSNPATTIALQAGGTVMNISNAGIAVTTYNNSATGFQVQNSSAVSILTVDTLNKIIQIGSNVTDATQVLLQLDSFSTFADTGTCTTTTNQGSLYYNTNTNAVRGCINNQWDDIVSSGVLGLQLFGIVPDSGLTPGDWIGISGINPSTGPCKVYMGSTTASVRWTGCTAYSGGRKVIVPAQNTDQAITTGAGVYAHVCLNGANNVVLITNSVTEITGWPAFSPSSPVLCLADISTTNGGSRITEIYDVRTFTNTTKEIVNSITTAASPGMIAQQTTTAGSVTPTTAVAALPSIRGVYIVTAGDVTANAMNAIIATAGPTYVKSTAGSVQAFVQSGTGKAGYALTSTISAVGYANLGVAVSAFSSTCAINADSCRGSVAVSLTLR